jgi:hypothetical protein
MSGFIKLFRDIQYHEFWQEKPFDKKSAWIDLLLMANYNGDKKLIGNKMVDVERGEILITNDDLQNRWGWGNTRVRSFLSLLQSESMIVLKTNQKQTSIKIVNYSVYQDCQTKNKPIPNQKQTNTKPNPKVYIYKEGKEDKEYKEEELKEIYKEKYLEFVFLTNEEYEKLIAQYSEPIIKEIIVRLNNYIGSTGTKYKSHYYTLLNWLRKEKKPLLDNPVSWDKMKSWAEKRRENDK